LISDQDQHVQAAEQAKQRVPVPNNTESV
jgi:hypothetical protein